MKSTAFILSSLVVPFALVGCVSDSEPHDEGLMDVEEATASPEAARAPVEVQPFEGIGAQNTAPAADALAQQALSPAGKSGAEIAVSLGGGAQSLVLLQLPIVNLLLNPGFENAQAGIPSGFIDHGSANASWFAGWGTAADSWPATSNDLNYGAIATWLKTDVVHTANKRSLLVSATTTNGGIAQQYWTSASSPPNNAYLRFSVWVYTVTGQVTIGLGSGGTGYTTRTSTQTGKWEYLQTCGTSFNNEVFIYTIGGPAVYYVDDANVSATPSPLLDQYCSPGAVVF
ncbi:hypothetical protein WMF45_26555 [Sorangium sp. So ce448]|uniref:hypothetical protein n=1 Tax=Sorangium sp. So ce448 TaxID=3133314 RepID=UPI003F647BDE